jgi:hypothetical protein
MLAGTRPGDTASKANGPRSQFARLLDYFRDGHSHILAGPEGGGALLTRICEGRMKWNRTGAGAATPPAPLTRDSFGAEGFRQLANANSEPQPEHVG